MRSNNHSVSNIRDKRQRIIAPAGSQITFAPPAVREIVEGDEYAGCFGALDNAEIRPHSNGGASPEAAPNLTPERAR